MADVAMPRLSDSMEEGTILKWLKADGDEVTEGEEIVEIETDKATMTYEAEAAGTLAIVAQEGETLPVGGVIARVGAPRGGEEAVAGNGAPAAPAQPVATPETEGNGAPAKASPLARRLASEHGVDLAALAGTGPGGRIVKADVEAAAGIAAPAPAPKPAPGPVRAEAQTAKGEVSHQELTRTQQVIARRMAESKATIPDFAIALDVDMEAAVALRAGLKAAAESGGTVVPSVNDMVVKAAALALREFPRVNGSYRDGRFELYSRVNVGVAVATDDALVVPTVFDADRKALAEIAGETRTLAARVRDGSIRPPELSGGTFTVSNIGMYGVTDFTAVINPPQAAILAVGAGEQRPVVKKGALAIANVMSVQMSCDHRVIDGALGATWLEAFKGYIEDPVTMLV
jgi:pyruvate dehydrogenase E2 component (dihydrolipoamide acetyltransferase)